MPFRTYLNGGDWVMVAEFTEIETGKRSDRPQLAKALALCRKQKAKLSLLSWIAFSRNLAFIASLIDSRVEFHAADNPRCQQAHDSHIGNRR
jgi:hypothetical protein